MLAMFDVTQIDLAPIGRGLLRLTITAVHYTGYGDARCGKCLCAAHDCCVAPVMPEKRQTDCCWSGIIHVDWLIGSWPVSRFDIVFRPAIR